MRGKKYLVFVYGTLRKGGHYHKIIKDCEFKGYGVADGKMAWAQFPRYPGAVFEKGGSVYGEVYSVSGQVRDELDILEGYNESVPEMSMYVRRPVSVTMEDGNTLEVETYEYTRTLNKEYMIPHGDFLRAQKEAN